MNLFTYSKIRIYLSSLIVISGASLILGGLAQLGGYRFYPELKFLHRPSLSFSDIQGFFKDLAVRRGGAYAFDALRQANLPPNTDIHLLGHAIGDVLYKQKGMEGINDCTQDFRNACSHSIVVGLFIDRGLNALEDITNVCRNAPGGTGAYAMCFHGLGHGILAYTGYDMERAVELCQKTGSEELNYVESAECIGGITMEMVSGVHDKTAWEKQKGKYFKATDPLYPCSASFIPMIGKANCLTYLTPYLWQVAGADLGSPKAEDFKKAFTYCSRLTGVYEQFQDICYGSFGKEFVTLAKSRDIRRVDEMTEAELKTVYDWCTLAEVKLGVASCLRQAINSLYWGGENKPYGAIKLCSVIDDAGLKDGCYKHVIGSFKYYNLTHPSRLYGLCRLLPESYKNECLRKDFMPIQKS